MDFHVRDRVFYTRSNGMRVSATVVGFAPDGLLHLEYFQDAVKVVNWQCKVESISFPWNLRWCLVAKVCGEHCEHIQDSRVLTLQLWAFCMDDNDQNKVSDQLSRLLGAAVGVPVF